MIKLKIKNINIPHLKVLMGMVPVFQTETDYSVIGSDGKRHFFKIEEEKEEKEDMKDVPEYDSNMMVKVVKMDNMQIHDHIMKYNEPPFLKAGDAFFVQNGKHDAAMFKIENVEKEDKSIEFTEELFCEEVEKMIEIIKIKDSWTVGENFLWLYTHELDYLFDVFRHKGLLENFLKHIESKYVPWIVNGKLAFIKKCYRKQ